MNLNVHPERRLITIQRIAITGSSGFYGKAVIDLLRKRIPECEILGIDIVESRRDQPDQFHQCDVSDPEVSRLISDFRPDTVIHLAFVVNPQRDENRMTKINVDGTKNVLGAVKACRPKRLLVSSNATAYGAWDDNPHRCPKNSHFGSDLSTSTRSKKWPSRACCNSSRMRIHGCPSAGPGRRG